jgi:hypothetical protein
VDRSGQRIAHADDDRSLETTGIPHGGGVAERAYQLSSFDAGGGVGFAGGSRSISPSSASIRRMIRS